MTCEPQTFPLCTSDPLCVDRWFDVPLEGNDTDHVTFTMTGLQAARLHHVTVAAATAVGQGPFSLVFSADTRVGGEAETELETKLVALCKCKNARNLSLHMMKCRIGQDTLKVIQSIGMCCLLFFEVQLLTFLPPPSSFSPFLSICPSLHESLFLQYLTASQ